ncbi:hypothetical protein Moror_5680 [Moniliophthora roreri MCA 2997]|uniref:Uncharacterized protein n=2 Tax=Moniliophthora roreri TaxID=221103 RepID=V2XTJ3_MONRO|nr:hypothetical protein Moror_5680 [Moniliophthora roreri MCA 2997]
MSSSRHTSVETVSALAGALDKVANEDDSSRTLSYVDERKVCDGNMIAYIPIATTAIYSCDIFFDEVATDSLQKWYC